SLHAADGKKIAELRTDAENSRPESAKGWQSAGIVGDLLIGIADQTYEDLLREKFRRAPIEVEIDAALNQRVRVLEVVREAADAGEFISRHRVEVSVTPACVDGTMTEADVGEAAG